MEDIPFIIQTVMSTASTERVTIFNLLLSYNGIIGTDKICESLEVSKPTALRTMTELKVAGLVDIPYRNKPNIEKEIKLKSKFDWFLTDEFADLSSGDEERVGKWMRKEKYPPRTQDGGEQKEEQPSDNTQDTEPETMESKDVRGGEIS
jgi:hypothetical protein